jgi:serine/threonine-protein kinase
MPSKLFGYDVIDMLGTGAGSRVYVVSDPQSGQIYALKHVTVRGPKDDRYVTQLETEYEVGRQLSHPGLRRSVDFRVVRSLLRKPLEAALVLEMVDASPIEFVLPATSAEIVAVFLQAADALAALHRAGFVHCDLKPGNILLGSDGRAKIIDFGQACKAGMLKQRIQGTPDFIAPEQVRCDACTPRTDIYSFGATLYWALCRKKIPTLYTVNRSENSFLLDDRVPPPHEINPSVPEALSRFVMECVRTDASRRPASMSEVSRRLDALHFTMTRPATSRQVEELDDTRMEMAVA